MKGKIILLVVLLSLLLGGCSFWMDDTYVSVKPYQVQQVQSEFEAVTADSYIGVREVLETMVGDCVQSAVIAVPGLDERTIDYYMSAATNYVIRDNAIGAYAVEQISYEIGTNGDELAIVVDISYRYNRFDILRITRVKDTAAAITEVENALQQYDPEVKLFVGEYTETDFLQLVQDYVDANPQLCVEMPQVTAAVYPDSGAERVIVLTFTYWNSREVLRSMQQNVQEVFEQLRPEGNSPQRLAEGVYTFLMNRHEYKVEKSLTPSYSLLRYGVGDHKAFATIFAAMCRQVGLNCQVVSGAKGGEAWHWNVILDGGNAYYVDLLRCYEAGAFEMLQESQMRGYVWDYSAYGSTAGQ